MDGLFILDKPERIKSKDVVLHIKSILKADRVGHVGTLDPNTTGVLTILIGKATKLSNLLSMKDKTYVATMNLHERVPKATLLASFKHFTGKIEQKVPKIAAVKRQVRTRKIDYIKLKKYVGRDATFEVKCQHGTYIRKLVHDIGEYLKVGAHMFELRRIQSGPFTIRDAVTMLKVEKLIEKGKFNFIKEPLYGVKTEKKVFIDELTTTSVSKGSPVFIPGVMKYDKFSKGDDVMIVSKKKLIALGVAEVDSPNLEGRGVAIKTDLVLV